MAVARMKIDTPTDSCPLLPLVLEQQVSRGSLVSAGLFIALAAATLLAPFSLLAASAAEEPAQFMATMSQPAVALQLTLALIVALAFVALPLRRLVRRAQQPRRIEVSSQGVSALDAVRGRTVWHEPLSAYRGIAHHIRTSLSGAQHEIVLVHPERSKSVVLQAADRINQAQVDAMAALLAVAEVPARTLYQGHRIDLWPFGRQAALKAA
jgi:hypothetical protein